MRATKEEERGEDFDSKFDLVYPLINLLDWCAQHDARD